MFWSYGVLFLWYDSGRIFFELLMQNHPPDFFRNLKVAQRNSPFRKTTMNLNIVQMS